LTEVATKLFARHGYNATTTAAIADAAGVTEPILYRHFKNKHDLFIAIVRDMSADTLRYWNTLLSVSDDPAQQIRVLAEQFPAHLHKLEDAYHVIHGALATSRDRKVLAVVREHYTQVEEFFTKIIVQGQATGKFRRDVDPRVPAWHMINVGIGYAMMELNIPGFGHFDISLAIDFILRGLQP
jgi:AcrR family transcriptional regulator